MDDGNVVSGFANHYPSKGLRLSQAVAASCSVPGVFPPISFEVPEGYDRPQLVDGGVYDTLGVDPIDRPSEETLMITANAGGIFQKAGLSRFLPRVSAFVRSSQMMPRLNSGQRMRVMVERFKVWGRWHDGGSVGPMPRFGRRGILFGLDTQLKDLPEAWLEGRPELPRWADASDIKQWRTELATVETSLEKFPLARCKELIYRSWWLTGASMVRRHPDVLPPDRYPVWSEW